MAPMFDAFWRALAYCLHPRVIALSFVPLLLMVALAGGLAYFFWEAAVAGVEAWLEGWELLQALLLWLERLGLGGLRAAFAPLLVAALATPLVVVLCLLLVAAFMTQAMVDLVGLRRFPDLERRRGGGFWSSLLMSLGSTLLAVLALLLSLPLWWIPPLVLVLPPLIWGWLTYRVFAYDALASHASAEERRELMRKHRGALLVMGVVTGYLGAAPNLIWVSGALFIVLAPLLVPLAIWVYTLVFAFASLWFAHYSLAALARHRGANEPEVLAPRGPGEPSPKPVGEGPILDAASSIVPSPVPKPPALPPTG